MSECNNISEATLADRLRNLKYNLNQNLIASGSPPTLKYIALIRVAISLWHAKLQRINLNHFKGKSRLIQVKHYGKQLLDCVPQLMIPKSLKFDLEPIISSIGEEISDYFCHQVNFYKSSTPKILKKYLNNLCWNQQGTINIIKTARKIIDQTNLNIEDKFILACNCCLEDKVQELMEILPISVIQHFKENQEPFSLPVFWSSYIKDKDFPRSIKGVPALEYLLRFANNSFNKAAVQYFLDNFATEGCKIRLASISYFIYGDDLSIRNCDNILLYFCTQLSQDQLNMMSLRIQLRLLRKLHKIPKWQNTFPVTKYIVELIKSKNFLSAFQIISFCWQKNILDLKEDISVWDTFVLCFKSEIERNIFEMCKIYLNISNNEKSMDVWELLFGIATAKNKRELIFSEKAMKYCGWLLCNKGLEYFDKFTNLALNSNEISQFRNNFFEVEGIMLCRMLVVNYTNYSTIDKILVKLCSEEINQFKKKLIYDKSNESILFFVIKNSMRKSMNPLLCINKFVSWCFAGNEEEISKFMTFALDLDSESYIYVREMFFNAIKKLIKRRKWKQVKKCWKWIFHATEKNIATPKEKLDRIKEVLGLTYAEQCPDYYLMVKNCHELLKIFIVSFFDTNEVEELIKELQRNGDLKSIIISLLQLKLSKADSFLEWCLFSDRNKIVDFKTKFINSMNLSLIFEYMEEDCNAKLGKALLTWLNPSALILKENFINRYKNELLLAVNDKNVKREMNNHWKKYNQSIIKNIELFTYLTEEKRYSSMKYEEIIDDADNSKKRPYEWEILRRDKRLRIFP